MPFIHEKTATVEPIFEAVCAGRSSWQGSDNEPFHIADKTATHALCGRDRRDWLVIDGNETRDPRELAARPFCCGNCRRSLRTDA